MTYRCCGADKRVESANNLRATRVRVCVAKDNGDNKRQ